MSSDIVTAAMVSASVSMLSCHRPCRPMNNNPHRVSRPIFQLPNIQARNVKSTTTPSQPMSGTGRASTGWAIRSAIAVPNASITDRIGLKKYVKSGLVFRPSPTRVCRSESQTCNHVVSAGARLRVLRPCSSPNNASQTASTPPSAAKY